MLGENVKVHFAGVENGNFLYDALAAGVKYALYSPYRFLVNKKPDADLRIPKTDKASGLEAIRLRHKDFNHVIQDSGLFTLMFNPKVEGNVTYQFLEQWQDMLIGFLMQNGLNCTAVEIDCQKLLSPKDAWKLRERMRHKCPNRIINVFHVEDGKDGLDSLIDFSEYIAISVPEIRRVHKGHYIEDVITLANYVKSKKPEIDIHLLGCTEIKILEKCRFCTSADSTSWLSGVSYGMMKHNGRRSHVSTINQDMIQERLKIIKSLLKEDGKHLTSGKGEKYNARASLCASLELRKYTNVCGEQS